MIGPRRRLVSLLLAFVLLPPLLLFALFLMVPTDWARSLLVDRLQQATGRPVHLKTLRFRTLGGVQLEDLQIGEVGAATDPWLRVAALRVDLSLAQLLSGRLQPREVEVVGLDLRVLRRRDGTLEFGDLLGGSPGPEAPADTPLPAAAAPAAAAPAAAAPAAAAPETGTDVVNLRLRDARILVVDEPSATRLEFQDVAGRATWEPSRAAIQELHGRLNDGPFELVAQLDRGAAAPAFEGELRAERVGLGVGMGALGYLVPVLAGMQAGFQGQLDLDLYVHGRGATTRAVQESLTGQGTVALDAIKLDDSQFLAELATFLPLPPEGRIGSVKSDFAIGGQRVASKDLTVTVAQVPIVLAGWTDFEGRLDYRVQAEGLADRLPPEAKGVLAELPIGLRDLMAVRVQGTAWAPVLTLDGVPLSGGRGDDRAGLRELTRRLRERILR